MAASVFGLAVTSPAVAADNYQYRLVPTDEVLARMSVAGLGDLGVSAGWRGGLARPDRSGGVLACLGDRARRSDLVVTGDARSVFRYRDLATLESRSEVFESAKMVASDWRRSARGPRLLACLRGELAGSVGSGGRVLSLTKLRVPRFAAHTAGWRALMEVKTSHGNADVLADFLICADDRTEVSLAQVALLTDAGIAPGMRVAEVRLASSLISRLKV